MSIQGWYYLHENGSLIYKPSSESAVDIRDSDFARHLWPMDTSSREGAWRILIEGAALGANMQRVMELAEKWGCDDVDAETYAERVGVRIDRDGNVWCATGPGFTNLQESPAGFGDSKLEAMADLCRQLGMHASKMWPATFSGMLSATSKENR